MGTGRSFFVLFTIVILLLFPAGLLFAIDFPTRPINITAGFGQGGGSDLLARLITDKLSEQLKVPVIVLNKPGAGGVVGGEFVAKSKPDGYNIFLLSTPVLLFRSDKPLTLR